MGKPILNLVMHVPEWKMLELGTFLDSVSVQRSIDKKELMITILLTDCSDTFKSRVEAMTTRSFKTQVLSIGGGSMASAYNEAIRRNDAQWIMFMACGDLLSDVYSLSMIMNLLPTDEWDALWTEYYSEQENKDGSEWINAIGDVDVRIHGKLFRNQFLLDNKILFDEEVGHDEGIVFFATVRSVLEYNRFAKITTKFVPYVHVDRLPEITPEIRDVLLSRHETNMAILRDVKKHSTVGKYAQVVMEVLCESYDLTLIRPKTDAAEAIRKDAAGIFRENADILRGMREEDTEIYLHDAYTTAIVLCNESYMKYGHEMYFDEDDGAFAEWLNGGCRAPKKAGKKTAQKEKQGRAAVLCGTRNVYDCMETVAKSLMYHTKVDRIYFLIEDDVFPRALPKQIICKNVSGQKWFDPKGQNYKNAWTYMCLMRAAFAKLLQDEHKALSLDIDVVINDDIGELWDLDLNGYYYAGVPETKRTSQLGTAYCNFGVIMMNLDMIRETGIDNAIIASLNKDRWGCPEQDAFNHFCKGKIMALPSKYNATRAGHYTAETNVEKISHYAGIKYWKQFKPVRKYAEMSWEEVMRHG